MTQSMEERRFVRLAGAVNAKAARLGLYGRINAVDLARIYVQSEGHCTYCGVGLDPLHCSFDHVIPFSRGRDDANTPANIVACCLTCQRSKATKTPDESQQARVLMVDCEVCGTRFKPRWADWTRGYGRTCSRACSGKKGGEMTKSPTALTPGGQSDRA